MKRAAVRNAESRPSVIFQSDNAERGRRSSPSPEEIQQRAFEIYMERRGNSMPRLEGRCSIQLSYEQTEKAAS
jgi:hypothetical protein